MERIRKEVQGVELVEPLFHDNKNQALRMKLMSLTEEAEANNEYVLSLMVMAISACTDLDLEGAGLALQRAGVSNAELGTEALKLCGIDFTTIQNEEESD